jgi:hypothetical protein
LWNKSNNESCFYVVVGGSGTYTDKFEVIGNVKAIGFQKTTGGTAHTLKS